MIAEFLDSWPLFQTTYLVGWLIAILLGCIGVWVVARGQIFLGAAVAQASTLGIALALWLAALPIAAHWQWLESDGTLASLAVLSSVVAALFTSRSKRAGQESTEAVTGWVFLVGASIPVLLVAHSPHGLEEVHRVFFSTVLGASNTDLWIFSALTAAVLLCAILLREKLALLAMDAETASVLGLRERHWRIALGITLGICVGLAIRSAGMIYTFGCLVLPALIAKNSTRNMLPTFFAAPAIAFLSAVASFVLAHHFDTPPAQTAVAFLCVLLALAWLFRRLREGH